MLPIKVRQENLHCQYAVYNEKPGDEFDFSDFSKVQNPNEIKKITKVLRRIVQSSGGREFIS